MEDQLLNICSISIEFLLVSWWWCIAVSSSPSTWIEIFALPEKFNMVVTESDLGPYSRTSYDIS